MQMLMWSQLKSTLRMRLKIQKLRYCMTRIQTKRYKSLQESLKRRRLMRESKRRKKHSKEMLASRITRKRFSRVFMHTLPLSSISINIYTKRQTPSQLCPSQSFPPSLFLPPALHHSEQVILKYQFDIVMNIERSKKLAGVTDNLNKALGKLLQNFSSNNEWADIQFWLTSVQVLLTDYPSPYIADKILLSKRLNQCTNPVVPQKGHETILKIHERIFKNMRASVDGNINDYIRLFAEDLGIYSVSILPHLVHTSDTKQRHDILRIINSYYLDLGKELIPMLAGMLKSLFSLYAITINPQTLHLIEIILHRILNAVGRRYVVGVTWSLILKYRDCKEGGIKFLSRVIDKMEYIKGEEEFEQSRGFSDIEREIEMMEQLQGGNPIPLPIPDRKSKDMILAHLNDQPDERSFDILLESPIANLETPDKQQSIQQPSEFDQHVHKDSVEGEQLEKILEEKQEESVNDSITNLNHPPEKEEIVEEEGSRKLGRMFESQAPFRTSLLEEENEIKLNTVPLMVSQGICMIKEGIDTNCTENNFPNLNTLVVNSLIACLEEDTPTIKRAALDFMFTHLRIKSQLLTEEDRKVLVQALLRLFKKKEISITKRVNRWIFGKQDDQNRYTINEKNEFVIPYIIHAFKQILQTVPTQEDNCTLPLKILQNFYIEHPHLVEITLKHIAMNVLRYIFNFGSKSDGWMKSSDFYEEVLKIGKRFLENLPSYYTIIFQSLGEAFIQGVRENKEEKAFEAIKYIDFCYINLMRHEHSLEELEYITVILQYICAGLSEISSKTETEKENKRLYKIYLKDAVLLVFNLIDRRKSVKKINKREQENINMKYFEETGENKLPPERLKYQEELKERELREDAKYVDINANLQVFFVRLGYVVRNFASIQEFEQTFKLCSMAIVRLQLHLPAQECQVLPKWFNTLQGAIKVNNPLVSLSAIEAMIKCLMWQAKHPIYNSFKLIIMQEKVNKVGTDYQKLALEKLWSLLDYPHMHSKIIDLIVGFSKYFPFQFTETVKRSFNTHSAPDKQASIQRFSHFWRLTGYKYKDLLNIHKEFVELNKVGLFRMLDFLDDQNPLVRHAAKNWLMESMTLLTRVIQPLLQELIAGCEEWYQTPKGIYLIQNVYDTNNIFSTFRRIRSILANGSYTFLRFVYQAEISQTLNEQREKVTQISSRLLTTQDKSEDNFKDNNRQEEREPVLPKSLENLQKSEAKGNRMSYLDLLIILAVKYIQGHAIESMGVQFYVGNSGVNTSAVELIETLLDYIDNPILCEKLIAYIIDYLFKVLNQVVLNKEYIMQIQLINLIKNIFFNSSFRKKADLPKIREFFKTVFTNKLFLVSILDGLHTPFAYVRSQFISFITVCIPLIADFLDPLECTECIRHILYTYYKIIKDIGGTLAKAVVEDTEQDSEALVQMGKNLSMSKILELEVKIKMEQKFVKFSDNLKQVGKTNEILSVLHGVQSILNYFYDLNKLNIKELNFEFTNPYTLFDTFKKIVTLGFANSEKNAKLVERKNFLHNFQTCQALLKDLQPVYETILRSWPLSEEFVRIGSEEFSSVGMRSFNFQRFNKYNKVVKDLINYVQEEKQSIWGKIYCIMQPMFCKFPKEIIDIYLKLWIRECSSVSNEKGRIASQPNRTQLLMKIMETIIVNNFSMNIVIHAFLESTAIEQLNHYYNTKGNDKKGTVLDYTIDKSQSKLLYFIYVYFNYVYLNEKELTYEPLLEIWSLIIKVLKPFQKSKTPLSAIWIIEIINLCAKKYSPKELLRNERFKTDLHALINEKLKYIASIASRKEVLFFSIPITKVKFDEQQHIDQYHIVLPLPPTIYDIYKSKKEDKNNSDNLALKEFRAGENSELQLRYRVYCYKILKRLGLQILQNTYLPQKTHWVVIRTCEWIDLILPVIQDKSLANMVYAECASEVLYDILDRARILFIKDLKPKVLQIFNKDDFFICNVNTLNYWSKIIDWIVSMDKNSETFYEYLDKVSLSSSYFTSESIENKKRIKSFERICFILYSGQKDKYAAKLKPLLLKIADVIKKPESAHAALLILVLFAIRILILRLSEITLNQVFMDIWPMILTLLMQTFSKQLVRVHIHNEISKNPNYLLAALKLLQMISLTNLTEFAHHQWIFICDYFGVDITVPEITSEMTEHFSKRPQLAKIISTDNCNQTTPFIYRPYLLNYVPQSSLNYIPASKPEERVNYSPEKRLIIVKDSFIRDEAELKLNTMLLMQYMIYLNEFRTYVDWKEVEEVIVNDFINLDSFIHQIS